MSYVIKAFGVIDEALDTVMGNTAGVGELSAYSQTFSTHKTNLGGSAYPHVSAVIFDCEQDGVTAVMPPEANAHLLQTLQIIAAEFDDSLTFEEQFRARFPSISPTLHYSAVTLWQSMEVPGFLQWKATVAGEIITFKVWLSDVEFRKSYDEYEIRVVPPVPNVTDLLQERAVVLDALADYTDMEKFTAIAAVKDGDPETKLVPLTLRWIDQATSQTLYLTWILVCYGPQALVYENQIEAIRNYLRDNTGTIPDEWEDIIPELNINTVINIVPLWHKVALRATGSIHYYHSLMIQAHEFAEIQSLRLGQPADESVVQRTRFASTKYKGLGFMATPDTNVPIEIDFGTLYPDYAQVPLQDMNLNRLKPNTRDAIKAIEAGIRTAEIYADGVTIDPTMHLQHDERFTYVCYNVNGVTHRIITRASFMAALGSQ